MDGLYSILSSSTYICYLHAMCKGIMTVMIDVATWLTRASSSYLKFHTCVGSNSSCLQCDIMNWPEESGVTNRRLNNMLFFVVYSWVNLQDMLLRSDMYMIGKSLTCHWTKTRMIINFIACLIQLSLWTLCELGLGYDSHYYAQRFWMATWGCTRWESCVEQLICTLFF